MSDSMIIYNDDAYTKINELISAGIIVNHIITDPPYNISKNNNFSTMKKPRTGVDFGLWDRGKFDLQNSLVAIQTHCRVRE